MYSLPKPHNPVCYTHHSRPSGLRFLGYHRKPGPRRIHHPFLGHRPRPLNRPVATGEKGPSDPPAAPLAPLACYIAGPENNPPRGLRVPTVIYAPNLIGVYQIDVEIPADWPTGTSNIFCVGQAGGGGLVPIGPPR